MKWINAEQQVTVTIYDEEHEEHIDKIMTVEEMLDSYTNEGCPTILFNPEQKTGKWIPGKELGRTMLGDCIIEIQYDGWTCSECHCLCEDSTKPTYKFCPNCGAYMRGEEE